MSEQSDRVWNAYEDLPPNKQAAYLEEIFPSVFGALEGLTQGNHAIFEHLETVIKRHSK